VGRPPSIVLVDDDVLVHEVLKLACADGAVSVVGEFADLGDVVAWCHRVRPDLVLIADSVDQVPVDGVVEELTRSGIRVVVLSRDPSPERLAALLARGAAGYLSFDATPAEVIAGILQVARGGVALHPAAAAVVVHQWRSLRNGGAGGGRNWPNLTNRETDVLTAMADGLATKAVALRLGVTFKTVENHKLRVFDKLGVRTQAHAVAMAINLGLVHPLPPEGPVAAAARVNGIHAL
jgi:two-component system response regulator NreC